MPNPIMPNFVTMLLAGLMMVSCNGTVGAPELAGSEWRPVQIGELQVDPDLEVFVQFRGEGELSGHGGCNRFFGPWQTEGDTIRIGPLASTRMACPDPQMELEAALFGALEAARSYRRERVDLTLFDADGGELARFAQTDAD